MKRFLLVVTILMVGWFGYSQDLGTLKVKVSNVEDIQGFMMIAVYDSAETFLTRDLVTGAKVEVSSELIVYEFKDLPFGEYAISVYHDVDSDGDLDTNFIGIPKEPYGFSNNDVNFFGAPTFKRSVFSHDHSGQEIKISLR